MMFALTWRNLWRNRRRTAIVVASICFAVMLAVVMRSMQAGVFDQLVRNLVGYHSGYLQVHAKGYWDERVPDNSMSSDEAFMNGMAEAPGVTGLIPRLEGFALASGDSTSRGCQVIGTDLDKEAGLMRLREMLVAGEIPMDGSGGLLLAEGLAEKLWLHVNDTIVLVGQGYHGSLAAGKYPIKGLLHFGVPQMNNSIAYLDMRSAQAFFGTGQRVTSLVIIIQDPDRMSNLAARLRVLAGEGFEVMTWKDMMPEIEGHIRADAASLSVWTGVLYLIITFGMFSALLMMMAERKYELGMLEALGMKKRWLIRGLFLESLLLGGSGIILGGLMALPIVALMREHPPRFSGEMARAFERFGFEPVFPTLLDGAIFMKEGAVVFMLVILVGMYPAWVVLRSDPVKAMKR